MKFYQLLIYSTIISLLWTSCEMARQDITSEVPSLLDRAEKIQLGKEWDAVQNAYAAQLKTLTKNPSDVESRLNLAAIFIREARVTGEHGHYYPAALQMTQEILDNARAPEDLRFRALVVRAGVQLSLHDFVNAEKTGVEALKLNPKNAQVYGVLVDANVELGNYKKAVALADQMINIKPDLRSYARISYLREIHGDIEGAIEALQLAIDAGVPGYEERAWAMQTLADFLHKYDRNEDAERVYNSILAERADYPFAIAGLGVVAMDQKEYALAESKLKEAIDIIPEVGYYIHLAELYKITNRAKDFQQTIEEIFPMLEDDERHGHNMNLEYAHIYKDLVDDLPKAKMYAEKEYSKRPDNIDVNKVLAEVLILENDLDNARKYITTAARTQSLDPEIQKILLIREGQLLSGLSK